MPTVEQCDLCRDADPDRCRKCRNRHIAHGDMLHDELRADGYRTLQERRICEQMEEQANYPFGRE